MQGMLTEQKQNRKGERLRRRTVLRIGEEWLMVRYRRPGRTALPRSLRQCETLLYPAGHPQNRVWSLSAFRFFLPQVFRKLERIYFPERCIGVALVAPTVTTDIRVALTQTLSFAGNYFIFTEDSAGETLIAELMDEYGLPAVLAEQKGLLRQADLVLTFENPNPWIRRCKSEAIILNLSDTETEIPYGRIVIDGVAIKPIAGLFELLPQDGDWSAFCGLYLPELREQLQLKHPVYARG